MMLKLGDPLPESYRWYYFVPSSGDQGRAWYEEYRSSDCFRAGIELDRALHLVRRHQVSLGKQILEASKAHLDGLRPQVSPAVAKVTERWFFSTYAYYFYAVGEFEKAKQALDRARQCVEEIIEEAPFLVVLAGACCELTLHHARISRRQRDWREMRSAIQKGRSMVAGLSPLCWLRSGRPIFYPDIDEFLRTITPANETERETLDLLLNVRARVTGYESAIRHVELLPNIVVPFA